MESRTKFPKETSLDWVSQTSLGNAEPSRDLNQSSISPTPKPLGTPWARGPSEWLTHHYAPPPPSPVSSVLGLPTAQFARDGGVYRGTGFPRLNPGESWHTGTRWSPSLVEATPGPRPGLRQMWTHRSGSAGRSQSNCFPHRLCVAQGPGSPASVSLSAVCAAGDLHLAGCSGLCVELTHGRLVPPASLAVWKETEDLMALHVKTKPMQRILLVCLSGRLVRVRGRGGLEKRKGRGSECEQGPPTLQEELAGAHRPFEWLECPPL